MTGWRWTVGLVLIAHGIGHLLGLVPLFRSELVEGWNLRSWLLTDAIGEGATKGIGAVVFAAVTIIFILSGMAMLEWGVPFEWWRPLAIAGAVASTLGLVLFWNAFPVLFPNKIGALAVNIVVLGGAVSLWDWPTDDMLGVTEEASSISRQPVA